MTKVWESGAWVGTGVADLVSQAELDAAVAGILDGATFTGDIVVPAETYGAGWNNSNEAPTKDDVYDKIQALAADLMLDTEGSMYSGMDNRYRFIEEFGADEGYDQEFDGANIADNTYPSGWSNISLEAGAVYRQSLGAGRIDWGGGGDNSNMQAVCRTLPVTTTFTATCHLFGMHDDPINSYLAHMVLYNSANGDFIHFGMFQPDPSPNDANPNTEHIPLFYVGHYADADSSTSTLAGPLRLYPAVGAHCYFRIIKSSDSSYQFQVTPDGGCWFNVGGALNINATLGADPTHIGFALNTPGASHVGCEWFRIRGLT
jgi:hypothetical protein